MIGIIIIGLMVLAVGFILGASWMDAGGKPTFEKKWWMP